MFLTQQEYPLYGDWLLRQDSSTLKTYFGISVTSEFVHNLVKRICENAVQHHCGLQKWNTLSDADKQEYCIRIATAVSDYVNNKSFHQVQLKDYNSAEHNFKLAFKQEVIAKCGLFVAKKKYSLWVVNEEGVPVDKTITKGLDIIQSSCPSAVRDKLKDIMKLLLSNVAVDELKQIIDKYTAELLTVLPEEIALNIGINSVSKYHVKGVPKKGCPYAVKGVLNYYTLAKELHIEDTYAQPNAGMKAKVVYLQENKWSFDTMSFLTWPKEFTNAGLLID
jgi:hypothetical protein